MNSVIFTTTYMTILLVVAVIAFVAFNRTFDRQVTNYQFSDFALPSITYGDPFFVHTFDNINLQPGYYNMSSLVIPYLQSGSPIPPEITFVYFFVSNYNGNYCYVSQVLPTGLSYFFSEYYNSSTVSGTFFVPFENAKLSLYIEVINMMSGEVYTYFLPNGIFLQRVAGPTMNLNLFNLSTMQVNSKKSTDKVFAKIDTLMKKKLLKDN